MKRYKNFVLKTKKGKSFFEAEDGTIFEVSKRTDGGLIVKAKRLDNEKVVQQNSDVYLNLPKISAGEYAKELSVYTDNNGDIAVVPPGWTVSGSNEENIIWGKDKGMVIYRIPEEKVSTINWESNQEVENLQQTYDQFVWIPVSKLTSNGTQDGISFNEKFGRRDYHFEEFSQEYEHAKFIEYLTDELILQIESVNKYGGYYYSRYEISKNSDGKAQSVRWNDPLTHIKPNEAKKIAHTIENTEMVKSHLPFSCEFDTILEWLFDSHTRTKEEIAQNSYLWGNHSVTYWAVPNFSSLRPRKTGKIPSNNNIYDICGNVDELTQEVYMPDNTECEFIVRGGIISDSDGFYHCVASRVGLVADDAKFGMHFRDYSNMIGFRAVLCIR